MHAVGRQNCADVNDGTTVTLFSQSADDRLRQDERPAEVSQKAVEFLDGVFSERLRVKDTRIVDQHVDPAEFLDGGCDDLLSRLRPRDVAGDDRQLGRLFELGGGADQLLLGPAIEHHVGTLSDEGLGDRVADAGARTGHDDGLLAHCGFLYGVDQFGKQDETGTGGRLDGAATRTECNTQLRGSALQRLVVAFLRLYADQRVDDLTAFEYQDRWNRLDAKSRRRFRILIDVQLADFDGTVVLLGELFDRGRHGTARTAPVSPEVNQHRLLAIEHFALKVVVCEVGLLDSSFLLLSGG